MSKYILRRLLISLATLLVILFVLFIMLDKMPGSPFNDEKLTEAQRLLLYTKYGLDQPFPIRFGKYLVNIGYCRRFRTFLCFRFIAGILDRL